MYTNWHGATGAVIGARHARAARNGQDAAALWVGAGGAAIAVCDGCSAGASSEVGARLGAQLAIGALASAIACGASAADPDIWAAMRAEVATAIAALVARDPRGTAAAVHDCFLFTIIAAAVTRDAAAVWALGDGAYALGGRACGLGPFADNQPPYLGYDLVGAPAEARLDVCADVGARDIVIATDGICDLVAANGDDLDRQLRELARPALAKPDALRRYLAVRARGSEEIDWDARRVVRAPAMLQDDCAVAVLRWELAS